MESCLARSAVLVLPGVLTVGAVGVRYVRFGDGEESNNLMVREEQEPVG